MPTIPNIYEAQRVGFNAEGRFREVSSGSVEFV
jgi:hypothetical protein